MRISIITLVVLFAFTTHLPQQSTDKISPEVIEFFSLADSVSQNYDHIKGFTINYSASQIEHFAKKYYDANCKPFDYRFYLHEEFTRWGQNFLKGYTHQYKPGFKLKLIRDLITETYGKYYMEILGIPYLLRIKVIEIKHGKYVSYSAGFTVSKTILVSKIEDIIKGDNKFTINETVNINILDIWPVAIRKLKKGCEYVLPLRPFNIRPFENKKRDYTELETMRNFRFQRKRISDH